MKKFITKIRPASLQAFLINLLYGKSFKRRLWVADKNIKARFFIDPFSNLGIALTANESYEIDTQRIISSIVKKGDVCLDIGANEGYFSIQMALIVGAHGKVLAFEPQTRLIPVIFRNINENHTYNVVVINTGVGRSLGKQKIQLFPDTNTGASSLVAKYKWNMEYEEIYVLDIDSYLKENDIDCVNFIKIDVEGFEKEVIEGMQSSLSQHKIKNILLDYHNSILIKRGVDSNEIHESIIRYGYLSKNNHSNVGYCLYSLE